MIWFPFHCDLKECYVQGEKCVYTADVYLLLCRVWWLSSRTSTACFLPDDVCCPILPCPVLSCRVLSCSGLFCLALSCLVVSCFVHSCLVPFCVVRFSLLPCFLMSRSPLFCSLLPRSFLFSSLLSRFLLPYSLIPLLSWHICCHVLSSPVFSCLVLSCPVLFRQFFPCSFFHSCSFFPLFFLSSFFLHPGEKKRTRSSALSSWRPSSRIFWLNQQLLRGLVAAKMHKKKTNWITDALEKEIVLVPGRAGRRVRKESCVWEGKEKKITKELKKSPRYWMCFRRFCVKVRSKERGKNVN